MLPPGAAIGRIGGAIEPPLQARARWSVDLIRLEACFSNLVLVLEQSDEGRINIGISWCEEEIAATGANAPPTGRLPVGVIEKIDAHSVSVAKAQQASARLCCCRFRPLMPLLQRPLVLFAMPRAVSAPLAPGKAALAAPAASYRATSLDSSGDKQVCELLR